MVTRAKLISDIELRLTRGKISDDFEVPKAQIAFWIDLLRDEIVADYLDRLIAAALPLDPFYITREECVLISTEDTPCVDDEDDCWERRIATLSGVPLGTLRDEGLLHVTNAVGEEVHRASHEELSTLRNMRLSKPSPSNLVYYREGSNLIVDGLAKNYSGTPKIKVAYVRSIRGWDIADSDDYPLSEQLVPELLEAVEAVARRELAEEITYEDQTNDGTQE